MINARAETVADQPAFRSAFQHRRCLLPADGFYEWASVNGKKQPWYFRLRDGSPFAFAGPWEHWEGPDGAAVESCAIITTDANETVRPIHERRPVLLDHKGYATWLERSAARAVLERLLLPCPDDWLTAYPVSTRVNNPRNDGPECIEPVGQPPPG